ncbi:MAG TPA: hypothetical protein VFF36_07800 [Planctomycetota bacterium]|nr:hypothetical protein [Planctomycetota bacterium]
MSPPADSALSGIDLDLALVAGGMLLIAALYAWMLRRSRPMLAVERDGLHVDRRTLPWSEVERVVYARGGQGALLRVITKHGLLVFREEQLIQHPDDVRRRIIEGAGLVRADVAEIPKGMALLPGDKYEEWRRPLPGEFAAAARGTVGPRPVTAKPGTGSAKDSGKKAAVGLAALLALIAKFGKALAVGLKFLLGGAKLGGLLPTAITMLASIWVYAQLWGWWFAGGLVGLLLLHELGHAAVIKAKGLRTSPIVFLPFFGAAIAIKDQYRDASVEAETAWGGPAIGTLAACGCFLAFLATDNPFWLGLAYTGAFLNLFNLLPLSPLDGGRIVTAISTWLWVVGLLLAVLLLLYTHSPLVLIVVVVGALRALRDWRLRRAGTAGDYYDLAPRYRALISAGYFGLCAFLGWMTWHTHVLLQAVVAA